MPCIVGTRYRLIAALKTFNNRTSIELMSIDRRSVTYDCLFGKKLLVTLSKNHPREKSVTQGKE